MKLKKEPKEVDFVIKSETWSEKDLVNFRKLMQKLKQRNKKNTAQKSKPIERALVVHILSFLGFDIY